MAPKSKAQADSPAEVETPAAEIEQPVEAAEAIADEPEGQAPADPSKPLPSHVHMKHPDGGSCDLYESDKDGNHRVPVEGIADMLSHGFEVVGTAD